jgi:hypothetical protein
MSLANYRFFKDGLPLRILSSVLITSDLVIAILILIPQYRSIACILGILIQSFFFLTMVFNYHKYFEYNCGCFVINTPHSIEFKSIAVNLLIMLLFMSVLILTIKPAQ